MATLPTSTNRALIYRSIYFALINSLHIKKNFSDLRQSLASSHEASFRLTALDLISNFRSEKKLLP